MVKILYMDKIAYFCKLDIGNGSKMNNNGRNWRIYISELSNYNIQNNGIYSRTNSWRYWRQG